MLKYLFLALVLVSGFAPAQAFAKPPKTDAGIDAGVPDAGPQVDASGVSFRYCSTMFQTCTFTGTRIVRYGVPLLNAWSYKVATTSILCTGTVFGEPAGSNGWTKICEYEILPGDPVEDAGVDAGPADAGTDAGYPQHDAGPFDPLNPATFTYSYCSAMFQTCHFTGPKWVRYGFPLTGEYNYLLIEEDEVLCSYTVFGEPSNGNTKVCETADVP